MIEAVNSHTGCDLAIDVEDEVLIPLSRASRHPLLRQGRREGKPISRATLERWRTKGISGVKLATLLVGGTRVTSDRAIRTFVARLNREQQPAVVDSAAQFRRAHIQAERELRAAGIL